jgi:hypothetical protein
MAHSLLQSSGSSSIALAASTTYYIWLGNCGATGTTAYETTEAESQITYHSAGILSKLYCLVTSNNRGASTLKVRKNGADGSQSLSIADSTTGQFEDASNTDTVSDGDELNYSLSTGAGGTGLTVPIFSCLFSASANTTVKLASVTTGIATTSSGVTRFTLVAGTLSTMATSDETFTALDINTAGVWENLFVYINTNARTTSTTVKTRINAADGNQSVSIGAGATGIFEDTSNTDTVSVNDNLDYSMTYAVDSNSINYNIIATEFTTTDNSFSVIQSDNVGESFTGGQTNYYPVAGGAVSEDSTETNFRADIRLNCTASNLVVLISVNGLTGDTTVKVRKNGADGSQSLSIAAGTTGLFEDATNSDILNSTDEVDYQVIAGAGVSSFIVRGIGMKIVTTLELLNAHRTLLGVGL